MTTIGDRIRSARLAKKMSAEDLAHRVGYATQSGIANLENRATGRGGYKLRHIARELGVSLDWLMFGDSIVYPGASETSVAFAAEPAPPWCVSAWPFRQITPDQWQCLTVLEQDTLERQILGLVNTSKSVCCKVQRDQHKL